MGGGILDKTDAALKSDLQSLLPLRVWEELREEARRRVVKARDDSARLAGEMGAAESAAVRVAEKIRGVKIELGEWEAGREARLRAQREELEALLASGGSGAARSGDSSTGGGSAGGGSSGGSAADDAPAASTAAAEDSEAGDDATDSAATLLAAQVASETASAQLASKRDEVREATAAHQQRVHGAFALAQQAAEAAMEADASASREHVRVAALKQRGEGLRSAVRAWGWSKQRIEAAKRAVAAGEAARRRVLEAEAAAQASAAAALRAPGGDAGSGVGSDDDDGPDHTQQLVHATEERARELRARALVARHQLDQATSSSAVVGSVEGGGVCSSCGQRVSAEHLVERQAALGATLAEAERLASDAEAAALRLQSAADGQRLAGVQTTLQGLQVEEKEAAAALKEAEAAQARCRQSLSDGRAKARDAEEASAALLAAAEAQVAALVTVEREAAAAVSEAAERVAVEERRAAERMAEEERRTALMRLQVEHAMAAVEALQAEANPHARRLQDDEAQHAVLVAQRAQLERSAAEAAACGALHTELQEHFGKRGVQNMLYTLALDQLEAAAAVYSSELSSGRLQLKLSFDEQLKSIRKLVHVRKTDVSIRSGSPALERSTCLVPRALPCASLRFPALPCASLRCFYCPARSD